MDPLHAKGMMRDVILKIGETEKDFKDFLVVGRIAVESAIQQRVNGMGRIGKEPCKNLLVDESRFDAASTHLIRAFNYHLEKMVEADAVHHERGQNFFSAAVNLAPSSHFYLRLPCLC